MKTKMILLSFVLIKFLNVYGQINLEATYSNASSNLYMVSLEVEGDKFVKIQRGDSAFRFIKLYNLNHSLWKTIDCNSFPIFTYLQQNGILNNGRFNYDILYITEHLFDNDDGIEFLYTVNASMCPQYFTGIYNEDGTAIFIQDSAAPFVHLNIPIVAKPIYNTVNGTKMILSFPCTNEANVYALSGILTSSNILAPENKNTYKSLSAYPNPFSNHVTISYKLPKGVKKGEIIIYDLNGVEIKRYYVDDSFNNLNLSNNDLSSGTYLYSLKVEDSLLETKRIVVIK